MFIVVGPYECVFRFAGQPGAEGNHECNHWDGPSGCNGEHEFPKDCPLKENPVFVRMATKAEQDDEDKLDFTNYYGGEESA
jgi:hypothetical protein